MAPRKESIIRKYFRKVLKGIKKFLYNRCLVNKRDIIREDAGNGKKYGIKLEDVDLQCGMSGEKVFNMKQHLKSIYPKFLFKEEIILSKKHLKSTSTQKEGAEATATESKESKTGSVSVTTSSSSTPNAPKPNTGRIEEKKLTKNKITNYGTVKQVRTSISVSRGMSVRALLVQVTVDGRPFSLLNDVGFSTFVKPAMNVLNLRYDNKNIADLVAQAAENIKQKLKKYMAGSLVSIKVDCVTRKKKSFIGINVQLGKEGKLVVYTLAVKEGTVRHTGENLKKIILQELESFGILPKHIYTITSDNGANMLKSIRLIENEQIKDHIEQMILDEEDGDDEIERKLMDSIESAKWDSDRIMSIHCAAHTLQLCVNDTLKNSWNIKDGVDPEGEVVELIDSYSTTISKARKVVLELRTQTVTLSLHEENLKSPPLDCPTSGSLPLKEFCTTYSKHGNAKLKLSEAEWSLLNEIKVSLEPCYHATKKLQSKNNTLTDVYKIWNMCHMSTGEIGTAFSNELVTNMIKRRKNLMENPVMLSAIYIDPRFSFELTSDQQQIAVKHILDVQARILDLKQDVQIPPSSDTDICKYERQLKVKHRQHKERSISKPNFKTTLISFSDVKRLSSKTNILQYWMNEESYSELQNVAFVILCVLGTQVSVEQLFS